MFSRYLLLERVAVLVAFAEEQLVVDVLLSSDKGGFWQTLVVAGDFNLFAVFAYFFEGVVVGSEFLKFLFEIAFHLGGYLIGALRDDAYGFIDVAGLFRAR